jgi:hypothetical protein
MTARAELDLASYDRFFPAQDFLPKGSFGNLIALPLQGACRQRGTTVFLNPTTLEPWPDQWAFLSSLPRLAPQMVDSLVDELRPIEAGPGSKPWLPSAVTGRRHRSRCGPSLGRCSPSNGSGCRLRWWRR